MSVKERTAAIRMILTGSDTENWHMLETYLTETTEKDRTAIARSLGGMYGLYEAEGPTLRMLYLWAALASNPEYLAGAAGQIPWTTGGNNAEKPPTPYTRPPSCALMSKPSTVRYAPTLLVLYREGTLRND